MPKKLTKEIFFERAIKVHGEKFDYTQSFYKNNRTNLTIICKVHGVFEQRPEIHLKGAGCKKCSGNIKYTTNTFVERANEVHNYTYRYTKAEYTNNKVKVIIICSKHGEFKQVPNHHLSGGGCPKCYDERRGDILKFTISKFIEKSKKAHGDYYNYSKANYQGNKEKVIIICPKHGEFSQAPQNHYRGQGCRRCSKVPVYNQETFIEAASKFHNNKYDYSKVSYLNTIQKTIIICPTHGEFKQQPGSHLKSGCQKCGIEVTKLKARSTTEEFILKAKEIHDNYYDYSKVEYVNNRVKVLLICSNHGEFLISPNSHLDNKSGCTKCGYEKVSNDLILPFDDFLKRAFNIHGKTYEYDESTYSMYSKKMRMICMIHGEFFQKPHSHISKESGCKECGYIKSSDKNRLTFSQFVKRARGIHGGKYDYSEVEYIDIEKSVIISCPIHGKFSQTPNSHLNTESGCRKCGNEITADKSRLTTEVFINQAREVHGNVYGYELVDYEKAHQEVKIICPRHGLFLQTPNAHKKGSSCPKCYSSHGERLVRDILTDNSIDFVEQKTFEWLKMKALLRCDFYLPHYNLVIEYNGKQHYQIVEHFGGEKGFESTKERDRIKREILKEHNVRLLEIRFDEVDVEKLILSKLIK